jgi:N-methylhydantoinase A
MARYRVGIDIGGTFTDFLVVSDEGLRLIHKSLSTPGNPSQAVLTGLTEIGELIGLEREEFLDSIDALIHGTTVATNAVLTRRGARTGLLCTEGFRDTLTFRDGTREESYNNRLAPPEPLSPRYLRLGVGGRLDPDGSEVEPLNVDDVREAAQTLKDEGVEAVAICFMHSPMNAEHEEAASKILSEILPDAYQTVSADLITQLRYYDRMSTTVLNSYVGPVISKYLAALTADLASAGFGGVLLIMQSNGGVASPAEVSREASRAVLSGPASGPAHALGVVRPLGLEDCLTVDMGGTSFDASVIRDGEPLMVTDGEIDRWRVALPTIGIHTIGAGGGSIAQVRDGLLQVGPMSAGASPGPACYGAGGELPTVTDADLVLGYITGGAFLEGRMTLDVERARAAIEEHVAKPLGISVEMAAAGIYNLANVNMAAGVREITVRRGLDPRDFPLVVAGGAGPVHAAAIARELSIPTLVVPREASVFCAAGMLYADFKHDFVQSMKDTLAELDPASIAERWQQMAERGKEVLSREGVGADAASVVPSLDLRYAGQWWDINVICPPEMLEGADIEQIAEEFHRQHETLFGYKSAEMPIEVLAARLTVVGDTPKAIAGHPSAGDEGEDSDGRIGERPIWSLDRQDFVDAPVYDGGKLGNDTRFSGPAIVELGTSTMVVLEGFEFSIHESGSYVLQASERSPGPDGVTGVEAVR